MPKPTIPSEIAKMSEEELVFRFVARHLSAEHLRSEMHVEAECEPGNHRYREDIVFRFSDNVSFVKSNLNRLIGNAAQALPTIDAVTPAAPPSAAPPRFVEGVFWLLLPRKLRDAIIGDAAEAYAQTMQKYGSRRWVATLDYCKEALFASLAAMRMSATEWVQMLFRRSS